MESRLGVAALVAAALLCVPAPALAGDGGADLSTSQTADDWLKLGLARYDAGDYKGAVDAFVAGNALDPRPTFLFAIAQAERRRGNCKGAVVYYRRFLATSPGEQQADAARQQMHVCEGAMIESSTPPPVAVETPRPSAVITIETHAPPTATTLPWYHDWIGDAALAATAILGGTGVGLFVASSADANAAGSAETYAQHATLMDRAASRHTGALLVLGAAAATAGVATWRIFFHHDTRALEVTPGPGAGLALGGSF
jgi:hypothetical protein